MRRWWAPLLVLLAALGAVAALVLPTTRGESTYEVHVVFDDSRGLLVGQLVQIAGARVGDITDVSLTDDHKARIHMQVEKRFAPFREDATCTIKPSGLIAENYVQCDPGTPERPPLEGRDGQPPTVPVENTTQPVSLTDLFEVWNAPTAQRLTVLLSTLGIATSGRGDDLNAILRRANPALALARRTIAALERQQEELVTIVDRSAEVVEELGRRPEQIRGLVRHAGRVATQTASQRGALAEGVQRLPGLLEQAQPALAELDALSTSATPLVDAIGDAAPAINRVSTDVPRLAEAARPTLAALAPVLRAGAATSRRAAPVAEVVATYAAASLPTTQTAAKMFTTLEQRGFLQDLLALFRNVALASARYDEQGHILPAHVTFTPCGRYATTPDPDCGALVEAKRDRTRRERRDRPAREREPARADARPTAPGLPALPKGPGLPKLPALPKVPGLPELDLNELLDPAGDDAVGRDTIDDLLGYLFG